MTNRIISLLAATGLMLLAAATPAVAADDVTIKPATLARGAHPQIPFQDRNLILHGDLRVEVPVKSMRLAGPSGEEYVIVTWGTGNRYRVRRVDAEGNLSLVRTGGARLGGLVLAGDGSRFATVAASPDSSTIRLYDAPTGSLEGTRTFRGYADVLDLDADRVVFGSWGPDRTVVWSTGNDRARTVARKVGYTASLATDRVGWLTKGPYQGGCSVVAALSDPDTVVWRSCRQRVAAFSPDGRRVATIHLLSDGIGPSGVQARTTRGRLLTRYTIPGWFGRIAWEDGDTLLMQANGAKKAAIVRCDGPDCERAWRLRATTY